MIKLKAVTKRLKNRLVLNDISVTFEKGKLYLLCGHNGSGKTMLLRMLCGLIKPDSGTVEKPEYTYGVMIETPNFILHETARQNLKFLASIQNKIGMKEIEKSLAEVHLLDEADNKVKNYSLGMKQRLGFCQAVMENPDVLLLDEPFNALDEEHFDLILQRILEMKQDTIIVIAAHGFDTEKYPVFDQVITMNNGKVTKITEL